MRGCASSCLAVHGTFFSGCSSCWLHGLWGGNYITNEICFHSQTSQSNQSSVCSGLLPAIVSIPTPTTLHAFLAFSILVPFSLLCLSSEIFCNVRPVLLMICCYFICPVPFAPVAKAAQATSYYYYLDQSKHNMGHICNSTEWKEDSPYMHTMLSDINWPVFALSNHIFQEPLLVEKIPRSWLLGFTITRAGSLACAFSSVHNFLLA